jgi:hypothetical protein
MSGNSGYGVLAMEVEVDGWAQAESVDATVEGEAVFGWGVVGIQEWGGTVMMFRSLLV